LIYGHHYLQIAGGKEEGPWHVARLTPFNASRMNNLEMTTFQVGHGQGVVEQVLAHRPVSEMQIDVHIKWYGSDIPVWQPLYGGDLLATTMVKAYCLEHEIPLSQPKPASTARKGRGRGKAAKA
jgi:hypothetical protein